MRILFVHTRYLQSAGGEDTTLDAEAALLRSKGHEIEILLFDNASMNDGFSGKLTAGINSVYNPKSARLLREAINRCKPEIIHVHNFFFTASPSVFYEAAKQKVPIVATIHNFRLICANALLLRENKVCELCANHIFPWYGVKYKCYHDSAVQSAMVGAMAAIHKLAGTWKNKVNAFITPSAFIRSRLLNSSFNAPAEKIIVKHNFIDDPGLAPAESREKFYLFVGRLSTEKGVEVLLAAWKNLPDHRLIVVGDGPDGRRLTDTYRHLPNVDFTGKKTRDEVVMLMKRCTALIFPSIWYEGLPLTIVEALATGTPVIASGLGGMQEMIQDGHNGLLFEAGNTDDLRLKIALFDNLPLQEKYSLYNNAREAYIEKYHPQKCYETIMEIYNNIVAVDRTS